jgi:metal-responsive CopG/Arc/MetJ family transcriptional regulator
VSINTVQFSVVKPEYKQELDSLARSKGFQNASQMARVALNEYIRRHPPKDVTAVLQDYLQGNI